MNARLRNQYANDPYYHRCILTGLISEKIDWHHVAYYKGCKIDELIAPVIHRKHVRGMDADAVHSCHETKQYVKYLTLKHWLQEHETFELLENKYPKKAWNTEWQLLDLIYSQK